MQLWFDKTLLIGVVLMRVVPHLAQEKASLYLLSKEKLWLCAKLPGMPGI
jgi:hypothetical protein